MEESRKKKKIEGIFDGLSLSQIIAGALAAVTSMLLASQIGIAGSVIGVAVGSIVSAVASQLYKKFLSASADKIRDLSPTVSLTGTSTQETDSSQESQPAGETALITRGVIRKTRTPNIDDPRLSEDITVRRAQLLRSRKKTKRSVIAVSVVSALAAVVLSAFVINFATTGEGLGTKTAPLIGIATQEYTASGSNAGTNTNTDGGTSTDSHTSQPEESTSNGSANNKPSGSGTENGSSGSGNTGQEGSGGTSGSGGSTSGSGGSESGGAGSGSGGSGSEAGSGSGSETDPGTGSGSGSSTNPGTGSGSGGSSSGTTSPSSSKAGSAPSA
ncbi:MAG: hypothetical protein RR547_11880 [Raoultibacter sp.]